MLTKITALTLAAVAYVNAQAFANVEDRAFLGGSMEMYPVEKRLQTNYTINNNDRKWDWIIESLNDTSVNQIRNATITDHKTKPIFDFGSDEASTQAVIFGWGPDYVGETPVTADIKVKCNLLVDFLYFYNLVPLHG